MAQQAIAVTHAYRNRVALAAANGTALPRAAFMAFGSGSRPYDGTLMGRRVLAPKEFEPDTEFELSLIFEY